MNKERRKLLDDISSRLNDIRDDLENVKSAEQEARDGLPENMQDGERATAMDDAIQEMEDADNELSDVVDRINALVEA